MFPEAQSGILPEDSTLLDSVTSSISLVASQSFLEAGKGDGKICGLLWEWLLRKSAVSAW